jgi:hypothetical protein
MNFIFKAFCIKIHGNCINKSVKAGKRSVLALSCFLADMLIVNTLFSFYFLPTTATLLIWYQLVTQLFPFLFEFSLIHFPLELMAVTVTHLHVNFPGFGNQWSQLISSKQVKLYPTGLSQPAPKNTYCLIQTTDNMPWMISPRWYQNTIQTFRPMTHWRFGHIYKNVIQNMYNL